MRASLKYNRGGDTYGTELLEEKTTISYYVLPSNKGSVALKDIERHTSLTLMLSTSEAKLLAHALISLITELE